MLISYNWLNEYIDLTGVSPKELADKMSRTGIEVENVVLPEEGLKKIVVGFVESCVPHPNSDHLSICQVNIGEKELSQIVCGASNITAGKKVIVALPGARITGNIKIKKGKMRGEVSKGMICSLQELGYTENIVPKEYVSGIYFLPKEAIVGESVFPYLCLNDAIIELSITPNRADALSMRGVAYEVGAIYKKKPIFETKQVLEDQTEAANQLLDVKIEELKDVPTYLMRIIKNVKIAESPLWLQTKLMNAGIRPINNVVDVTNFVLLEFGQPMHAFDYAKIKSQEIVVRRGKTGETLVTLDEEERNITEENIVITDGKLPIALAGVMGGLDSEITEETTTVALEAALFDPISIRKTSKQFNLRSESSSRFEKGINQATVREACDYAAALISELSGGTILEGIVVGSEKQPEPVFVEITLEKINRVLGTELSSETVGDIFAALGFAYEETENIYNIQIPPRRWDIAIEADIIEEVARIYGYDRLPATLPTGITLAGSLTESQRLTREIKAILEGNGLYEAVSYALTTEEKASQFVWKESLSTKLQSPMSEERTTLRKNLICGLLDNIAYNSARKNENVAFYEVGRVFYQQESNLSLPVEENHLAMAITGSWKQKDWQTAKQVVDFYLLKGIVENVFSLLGLLSEITFEATSELLEMHPGRTAWIQYKQKTIGFLGQVHPSIAKNFSVPETYVCEINLQELFTVERVGIQYHSVSKYPEVKRDIALLVSEDISHSQLLAVIQEAGGKYLQEVQLFDIYQGDTIECGKKSMAYALTFQNSEATLIEEEINQAMNKIEKALETAYQIIIR